MRLTRNLDKDRGFVNGAIGIVVHKFTDAIFTMRLTTGAMILVHPVRSGDVVHLPCAYGYATTIRRAQGQSLDIGCLYFDHCYPPERGYGYVGASRFRTRAGVYHFGKLRRTDWLPVGGAASGYEEQTTRGPESADEAYDDQDAENDRFYSSSEDEEDDMNGKNLELEERAIEDYPSDDSEEEMYADLDASPLLEPAPIVGPVADFGGIA